MKFGNAGARIGRLHHHSGAVAALVLGLPLLAFALSVNFPKAAYGFQSDESTYYSLAHSLAEDFDFAFRREDLVRVWEEFPTGPEGIFLKRGKTVDAALSSRFPYVRWIAQDDPRSDRLFYGKAYIYPLVASPFVWLFGTNGFLVLHAILMTLNFAAAYAFLRRRSSESASLVYALAFFGASAAPVYLVWLTPDFFNLSTVLYGYFFWAYKEAARSREAGSGSAPAGSAWLYGRRSDFVAAVLLGIATFSKPTHVFTILPLLVLAAFRRRWLHGAAVGATFGLVVAGLFALNVAITGELNYQGGDRKTFYGGTGFPYQREGATFETVGLDRATDRVPVEVLFSRDASLTVLRHNLLYFTLGRHTGLVPYFFPGVFSAGLFLLAGRRRQGWQWLVALTLAIGSLALLVYMPFTYSGGGGPVGNRYFMGFYPLFLFLTPPLATAGSGLVALAIGAVFTAPLVLNPFYTSFYPAEHPKRGPYRVLPVELSLVNDLPVNVTPARAKQPLGGTPPVTAYFLDDNAYNREGDAFWVRGASRAELIVRAPARLEPDGTHTTLEIARLNVELRTGDVANRVTLRTRGASRTVDMHPGETRVVTLTMGKGLPYKPLPGHPTNYAYLVSIGCERGFVPLFTSGSRDSRFLGVLVRLVPAYRQ